MQGPKRVFKWSSLKESVELCNNLFAQCRNTPIIAEDGRIESRERDFHQLLIESKGRDSLARYVEHRDGNKEVIFGLLEDIGNTLDTCLRIGKLCYYFHNQVSHGCWLALVLRLITKALTNGEASNAQDNQDNNSHPKGQSRRNSSSSPPFNSDYSSDEDLDSDASIASDKTSTTEELATTDPASLQLRRHKNYLDVFIGDLARRLAVLRDQAVRPPTFEADRHYDESDYGELRRYLTTLVLLQPYELSLLNRLGIRSSIGVTIVTRAWLTDVARLSSVQARLINGVIRRHHRLSFARKSIPRSNPSPKDEGQHTINTSPEVPQKGPATFADATIQFAPDLLQPHSSKMAALEISTNNSPSASGTRITPTQDYPHIPTNTADAAPPNCPFCGDRLSNRDIGSDTAWRLLQYRYTRTFSILADSRTDRTLLATYGPTLV